ncbi:MAG TPA: DICT sensory domain-containing protein, partial [Solirubrobacteraceae bacterium]|nr:DICT sensory domain-containing protein [Solirubrobacteraceae bacterium]
MNRPDPTPDLSIGDVAAQTGVGESTLRMWEARYSFPTPRRLPSGHRRYSVQDLARIQAVLRARDEGLPLPFAINRARRLESEPQPSVYGGLRAQFSHLQPHRLPKRALIWMSRALEDECCARSPRPLLFAAFQHERFYRHVEPRWRELARSAQRAIVLADFPELRTPAAAPAEIPIEQTDPLMREWVVVCDAPQFSACLVAWERPHAVGEPRMFETIWTVEPDVARETARLCCELAGRRAPELVEDLRDRLADTPVSAGQSHVRGAVE